MRVEFGINSMPTASPREVIGWAREVDAGARRFWLSVHVDDKVRFLRDWASRVLPAFR
jgi:hypothetical protein